MSKQLSACAAAAALAAALSSAGARPIFAQDAARPSEADRSQDAARQEVDAAVARLKAMEDELLVQREQVERLKQLQRAGALDELEYKRAYENLKRADDQVKAAQGLVERYRLSTVKAVPFSRRITVNLKDANIREAAEAISKAAGFQIVVDENVSKDKKLSVQAENVPAGTVLEVMAEQAGLMIAPAKEGVVLKRWPSLKVNGKEETFRGRIAPWADEWGTPPTRSLSAKIPILSELPLVGTLFQKTPDGVPARPWTTNPPAVTFTTPSASRTLRGGNSPLAMTSLGDKTVVTAHLGRSADGRESGIWLTVYRLEGGEMRKVSSTFQKLDGVSESADPLGTRLRLTQPFFDGPDDAAGITNPNLAIPSRPSRAPSAPAAPKGGAPLPPAPAQPSDPSLPLATVKPATPAASAGRPTTAPTAKPAPATPVAPPAPTPSPNPPLSPTPPATAGAAAPAPTPAGKG